jgi:hypothetical protein
VEKEEKEVEEEVEIGKVIRNLQAGAQIHKNNSATIGVKTCNHNL